MQKKRDINWFLFSPRGRISRAPFWAFQLIVTLITLVVIMPDFNALLAAAAALPPAALDDMETLYGLPEYQSFAKTLYIAQSLLVLPSLMVNIKRWHDRGRSAWWFLLEIFIFVPGAASMIGLIAYLFISIECGFFRGTPGPNKYGPDPLAPQQPVPNREVPPSADERKDDSHFDA